MVVTLLEVSEKEEGVVALLLPTGLLKPALGWSRYRDANPVPTTPLADNLTTDNIERARVRVCVCVSWCV